MVEDYLKSNAASIEHVHEYVKMKTVLLGEKGEATKYEEMALAALEQDANKAGKVYVVANTLRRLVKSGATGDKYRQRAKALFKYAKLFD